MRDARLTIFAKQMLAGATEPERRMWLALRTGRFHGIKFRRQKVIGPYIVDFAARAPMLVVEIDGDTHSERESHDAERSHYLAQCGYRVLRFTNSDVMTNLDGVLTTLSDMIDSPVPLSQPSPLKGRGL